MALQPLPPSIVFTSDRVAHVSGRYSHGSDQWLGQSAYAIGVLGHVLGVQLVICWQVFVGICWTRVPQLTSQHMSGLMVAASYTCDLPAGGWGLISHRVA